MNTLNLQIRNGTAKINCYLFEMDKNFNNSIKLYDKPDSRVSKKKPNKSYETIKDTARSEISKNNSFDVQETYADEETETIYKYTDTHLQESEMLTIDIKHGNKINIKDKHFIAHYNLIGFETLDGTAFDELQKASLEIAMRPLFFYTNSGMINHKLRCLMRCDTEEYIHDKIFPYTPSMAGRFTTKGCAVYKGKSLLFNWLVSVCEFDRKSRMTKPTKMCEQLLDDINSGRLHLSDRVKDIDILTYISDEDSDYTYQKITNTLSHNLTDHPHFDYELPCKNKAKYEDRFTETTLKFILEGKNSEWRTLLNDKIEFENEIIRNIEYFCSLKLLIQPFITKNQSVLDIIRSKFGSTTEKVYLFLSYITHGKITWSELEMLVNGKCTNNCILQLLQLFSIPITRRIGFMQAFMTAEIRIYDNDLSFTCCQLVHDLRLLQNFICRPILEIIKFHTKNLIRIVNRCSVKVQRVFMLLKIITRLTKLNMVQSKVNNIDYMMLKTSLLIKDITAVHELIFKSTCCAVTKGRCNSIRVLFHTMKISCSYNLSKAFYIQPRDPFLKNIEKVNHCLLAMRDTKKESLPPDTYRVDIYYHLYKGDHNNSIEMFKRFMELNSKDPNLIKIESFNTLGCFPSGEIWTFSDTSWVNPFDSSQNLSENNFTTLTLNYALSEDSNRVNETIDNINTSETWKHMIPE